MQGERKQIAHNAALQLEERRLLEQCFYPWFIPQHTEKVIQFSCLNATSFGMGSKVLKGRGKCIINIGVQSLAGTARKISLVPTSPPPPYMINEFLRQVQNNTLQLVKLFRIQLYIKLQIKPLMLFNLDSSFQAQACVHAHAHKINSKVEMLWRNLCNQGFKSRKGQRGHATFYSTTPCRHSHPSNSFS